MRLLATLLLSALPAAAAAAGDGTLGDPRVGDPGRGAAVYERCQACHSLTRNRTGPKHCGLIGRKAGGVAGFSYSDAMKDSGILWNAESLDRFLENPFKAVPGTRMGYAGVKDPQERADLIVFLAAAGDCGEGS